ncbi:uncharacterized protein B0J16DRAFT_337199 [Fusarium flagelliforme]|uniref:uncharacterized protein n=1 Tax=Fusarium flagelliforme TaxID=2675880 RepID=UPI001E8D10B5|nr:uncharacterized protein B0J16DRAFT_337199 [Fusarium flagelliforme]KAH7188452.1 hypothetical protein B0J16DRAFT_337199 [Fusarium flagelliforme]
MLNRSMMSAFRPLASMRVSLGNTALHSRHFSATPTRCLSAVFAETENSELNNVLIDVQEKIILPAYLPEAQRKLVFNSAKSDYIKRNPVVIELDGLEHTFTYIDRTRDIPNSKKALAQATRLMKTKEEWDNIATFLAGYRKAGIRLTREHYEAIIRRACDSQQEYSIIECAKQAVKTGLALKYESYVILLMSSINGKVGNTAEETLQALKWNRLVSDLTQRPEHQLQGRRPRDLPHFNPAIRGALLFAQAHGIQTQQAAGESAEALIKELRDNVEFISSAWAGQELSDLTKSSYLKIFHPRHGQESAEFHLAPYHYIRVLAQNIRAMELAQEIIGDIAKDLTPVHDAMEQHLEDFIKAGSLNKKGYGDVYESATGRKPAWEKYLTA